MHREQVLLQSRSFADWLAQDPRWGSGRRSSSSTGKCWTRLLSPNNTGRGDKRKKRVKIEKIRFYLVWKNEFILKKWANILFRYLVVFLHHLHGQPMNGWLEISLLCIHHHSNVKIFCSLNTINYHIIVAKKVIT